MNDKENLSAAIIGMTVDYLTRFMLGAKIQEAFKISIKGAEIANKIAHEGAIDELSKYLNGVNGLDDESIINACKCSTFDVWYRAPMDAIKAKTASDTMPDAFTISNLRIMVERNLNFFEIYGPITVDGFTFETNGYTKTVSSGDGDFLTADTLWDIKVIKSKPTNKHTLQLLMYWIMGQHSQKAEYKDITKFGIFNPRLNIVYRLDVKDIPDSIIKAVETEVICY